jgi:hypothetical protein
MSITKIFYTMYMFMQYAILNSTLRQHTNRVDVEII